jgi:hypothetical protein
MSTPRDFLRAAPELGYANVERGARPFGAVVVNVMTIVTKILSPTLR